VKAHHFDTEFDKQVVAIKQKLKKENTDLSSAMLKKFEKEKEELKKTLLFNADQHQDS